MINISCHKLQRGKEEIIILRTRESDGYEGCDGVAVIVVIDSSCSSDSNSL